MTSTALVPFSTALVVTSAYRLPHRAPLTTNSFRITQLFNADCRQPFSIRPVPTVARERCLDETRMSHLTGSVWTGNGAFPEAATDVDRPTKQRGKENGASHGGALFGRWMLLEVAPSTMHLRRSPSQLALVHPYNPTISA
ncbi:hypothetical protein LZ30DRAFT_150923 [Colletotrichum cereale]|nr:hypothetical protein LZ30DRAFT_150923 [Colletotrichum cereale]